MLDLFPSENSKRVIIVLVIVALGVLMAARKQFVTNTSVIFYPYEYSLVEGHEKELGHLHPLFRKDVFAPLALMIPYSLHYNKGFHVISAMLYWILVVALMTLVIRQAGFDYYSSIVLTMFVLFVGGLAAREMFDIPFMGPAPYVGYQNFDYRIFVTPLTLTSILLAFRGRLILSGILLGLTTVIHIKFGLRVFGLIMGCIILWNLWGYRRVKKPQLKISWRLVAGFGCCWTILFVGTYLYIQNSLNLFAGLEVPRVDTPFLSRLGWLIKNEAGDYMISSYFRSDVPFFGFLFLSFATLILCELIHRYTHDTKLKIMAVILIFSVLMALLFFGYGFLFETLLIDRLPLSWSTMLMLARAWDLIWVVPIAFTIAVCSYLLLRVEDLGRKFQKPIVPIRNFFLHFAFAGFVLLNFYIFIDKKDGFIFKKADPKVLPNMNMPYTQICTEDTELYNKTMDRLWELVAKEEEVKFYKQLQIIENIFERTLNPAKIKKTNNPDVKNLRALYDFKSHRYSLASRELGIGLVGEDSPWSGQDEMRYFWSCAEKGLGVHRGRIEIPFRDFYDVSQWISKNTPLDRGVISPPYFQKFSVYSQRVDFYDYKRDGHTGYMVKEYYPISLHRLHALTGPYAPIIESGIESGGRFGMRGRAYFLSLRQEDLHKIRQSYPHYDYLVTENQTLLGFPKLYSNTSFAVYNISE